jgi:predicted DNA-binding transcriptional regulator YafY
MPKNKEALIRYRVINRCLKDYKYVTREKLIESCERTLDIYPISERTFNADIHAMRYDNGLGYYAPIRYDRDREAYFYEDPGYSIDNIPLNEEEIQSLSFAATLLDQFKGVSIFNKFAGSVQKIIDAVNIHRASDEETMLNFIDFEKCPYFKGSEHLQVLIRAIRLKQVVYITYRAFQSEKDHHHDIHPYLLKEYRNRWYLIGFHDYFREIRIYGLDRIVSIEEKPEMIYRESDFSSEQYFRNTIGIFSPVTDPPEIVLQFSKETAQYILTQPIHESQITIEEKDDSVTFSLKVHPTVELIQVILGWGDSVKVLEPEFLRNRIVETLTKMTGLYIS